MCEERVITPQQYAALVSAPTFTVGLVSFQFEILTTLFLPFPPYTKSRIAGLISSVCVFFLFCCIHQPRKHILIMLTDDDVSNYVTVV